MTDAGETPNGLGSIDTTALEQLLELRGEQKQIKDYQGRASGMKERVAGPVYERVGRDYHARFDALEERARPLKVQVREQYRKLRALEDGLRTAHGDAKLAKEELEFRHSVGELDDAQLTERLKEPTRILEESQTQLSDVEKQKERFLEAFGPGEDIEGKEPEAPPPPPPAPEPPPVPVEAAAPPPPPPPVARVADDAQATLSEGSQPPPPLPGGPEPTMVGNVPGVIARDVDMVWEPAMAAEATLMVPLAGMQAATGSLPAITVPEARLETTNMPEKREYKLGTVNNIGRAESNEIRLMEGGVSRKHAVINGSPDGYIIKDLRSQNGTFVNDERIKAEKPLNDGDRLGIGDLQLVFRCKPPK